MIASSDAVDAAEHGEPCSVRELRSVRGLLRAAVWRGLDFLLALVLLVVLAPVMLVLAVAIRLDSPGPALFRQRRVGQGTEPFTVLKYRTMFAAADQTIHRDFVQAMIDGEPQTTSDGHRELYKLTGDARVTGAGRWLRRLSLDELPQLLNVLRGEMSLVGPRPVIEYEVERFPEPWFERFRAKPGLTGLWQVSGRSEMTYSEMVELDIDFVRRATIGLYLSILVRTAWVLLFRRQAA